MGLNFGEFDEEQNYGRNLDFGGLASLPEETEYDQFRAEYLARKERGMGAATWAFISGLPEAASRFIKEDVGNALSNDSMLASLFGLKGKEDFKGSWKALSKSPELGLRDTWNMIKTVQSSVRDYFDPEVKGEEEIQRAFARHKFELNYYNDAREHYLDQAAGKFKDDVNLLADFVDPTNLVPSLYGDAFIKQGLRKSIKGAAKGVSVTAKGAEKLAGGVEATLGFPAKVLEKKIPKGGNIYRGLQAGSVMAVGSDPFGGVATTMVTVGVAEGLSKVAKAVSKEVSEVAGVLASPSSHARFLFKLSTNENVSKQTRALAARAYKLRGTRMYDVVFDALVSGVSSGAMQAAIEFAKGKSAEDMSMAAGGGFALGAPVGALAGSRGSGKTDEARSDQGIENYLSNKGQMLNKDTIAALKKVDKKTLVALSTLDEFSGLGNIRLQLLDQDSFAKVVGVDPKDAPNAFYNRESQNIIINEAKIAEGTDAASKIVLHEHGHDIMRQMMGSNPLMRRKILENFYDPNGKEFFFRDSEGSISGSIKVNEQAQQFATDYADKIRKTDEDYANSVEGTNAYLLAEEIAAEQFSGLMRESPNVFAKYNKSFRHSLMNTARLALSKMGIVEPDSGNLIDSPISESMLKNDGVANVFNNYMQARNDHYRQRADDIEIGRKHEPRAGQSSDNRFTELFGGKGVSTAIANHYMLKDQTMFDELVQQASLDAQSLDKDLTGIGKGAEGKRLSEGVKSVFRTAGSSAQAAMDFIDFLQVSIDRRQQIKFGYRSANWNGKTGYNPFYERSFTPIGWQISPKKPSIRRGRRVFPNLKVVGYDADIIASNVELLQQAGFITDQTKFFEDFAAHAESVLQESGEGRINPLGMGENELFTAALGMKESGQKLQDPKLNEFFSNPDNKLKNAYKSYDLGGMAGAANMNKGGFAFDYNNAKHNYMPMLSGAGADGTTIPQTMFMPSGNRNRVQKSPLKNNLLDKALPSFKQEKMSVEQIKAEIAKTKGASEFLNDIGITDKVLRDISNGKTIDKSSLEFLIKANQNVIDFNIDSSKEGESLYEDYTEQGYRENYEEITYSLPHSEMYPMGDRSGGHWGSDRVMMHIRKTDRILDDGTMSYHIEEIQSDWHQAAIKRGYIGDDGARQAKALEAVQTAKDAMTKGQDDYQQKAQTKVLGKLLDNTLYWNLHETYWADSKESRVGTMLADVTWSEMDATMRGNISKDMDITPARQRSRLFEYKSELGVMAAFYERIYKKINEAEKLKQNKERGLFDPNVFTKEDQALLDELGADRYETLYDSHQKAARTGAPSEKETLGYTRDEVKKLRDQAQFLKEFLLGQMDQVMTDMYADPEIRTLRETYKAAQKKSGEYKDDRQANAPYKKSYVSRALADSIVNAWNEGKKYITWVTGERNAKMNQLDQHFTSVQVQQGFGDMKVLAESRSGRIIRKTVKDEEELARVIGKDAAKIAKEKLRQKATGESVEMADIEVQHLGRRQFYDKKVVEAAKRLAKVMGTRPPMKSKIQLKTPDRTQEVWLMELPETKPELPMYMPDIKTGKEDVQTASLIQESAIGNRGTFDPSNPDIRYMPNLSNYTQELWKSPVQEITSADTSINSERLPAGYNNLIKKNVFKKGQSVIDIGGGKFDNAVEKLKTLGARLYVYDPFNRTQEHNDRVVEAVADGAADIAVSNNTLNVINEDANVMRVIAQAHNALKQNGKAYFTVYEGDRSGVSKLTSKGFQRNLPTTAYIDAVKKVFGEQVRKQGNLIVATKQPVSLKEKDLIYMPDGEQESTHGYIPPVQVEINEGHLDKHYIPDFLVGKRVFPVLGDRLKVGWHTARSGNRFECRGGHDHPMYEGHKGQVAWACGQSGEKHDSVVAGLLKGIQKSDGYAATVLMSEEALASNRTYARIMMDELEYDSFHVQGGKAIVEKYIQQAAESLDLPIRNLDDLKAVTPTMVFDLRKKLLSRVMPAAYKREIKKNAPKGYKAMDWRDLYKSLASYRDADGYRHGDIIHILKFDTANPMINLKDIGATPDPTYDVSFRGTAVHTMEGHVSAFDIFKQGLDVFAYDEEFNAMEKKKINPERTIQPDRRLGSSAYRVMQMRTGHDLMQRPLTKENTLPSKPIKYKTKLKADEKSLYFRDQRNTKLRKEKESLL